MTVPRVRMAAFLAAAMAALPLPCVGADGPPLGDALQVEILPEKPVFPFGEVPTFFFRLTNRGAAPVPLGPVSRVDGAWWLCCFNVNSAVPAAHFGSLRSGRILQPEEAREPFAVAPGATVVVRVAPKVASWIFGEEVHQWAVPPGEYTAFGEFLRTGGGAGSPGPSERVGSGPARFAIADTDPAALARLRCHSAGEGLESLRMWVEVARSSTPGVAWEADLWATNVGQAPIALGDDRFRICWSWEGGTSGCQYGIQAVRVGAPWSDTHEVSDLQPGDARVVRGMNLRGPEGSGLTVWGFYRPAGDERGDRKVLSERAVLDFPPRE